MEVDQLALTYQQTQASLLSAQAHLQSSLDGFKIGLGLPTELDVRMDDSVLDQFELNDERLDTIRTGSTPSYSNSCRTKSCHVPSWLTRRVRSSPLLAELEQVHDQVVAELVKWRAKLAATEKAGFSGPDAAHNKEIFQREDALSRKIQTVLDETDQNIDDNQDKLASFLAKLDSTPGDEASNTLRKLVSKELRSRLSEIFVAQTQTRVFLIAFPPVDLTVNQAIQIALGNRLDLQNALAQVTDAWRNVEVDANALQGILNFVYNGSFNEAPGHAGLFRFDAASSIQTFGLQFDAPINRRAERNQYRADQIQYQRDRRAYMLARDTVVQQIRLDMRQLVLAAADVRDQSRADHHRVAPARAGRVRTFGHRTDATAPVTLNSVATLWQRVLTARNALISTWVSYETSRMSLYRDFDLMDIDSNGVWTNENDQTAIRHRPSKRRIRPSLQPRHSRPNPRPRAQRRLRQHFLRRRRARRKTQPAPRRRDGSLRQRTTPRTSRAQAADQPTPPRPGAAPQPPARRQPSPFAPPRPGP